MFALLRQRNFALIWWGGLVSLTGNRVLSVALPFYVYQQTGSTIATAAMVLATIVPSMLFSSIAGVFVDRWNRKSVMVMTNLLLALMLLPLLTIRVMGWMWLVYLVAFGETMVSIFFGLAENALLPELVDKNQLHSANSLNSFNDSLARLIGSALGGILLGVWGLESVVLFDCFSYLFAGMLVFFVNVPSGKMRTAFHTSTFVVPALQSFQHRWQEGLSTVYSEQIVAVIMVVSGLTTMGGTMMDPLIAPFFEDALHTNATTFGSVLTVQGIGGIVGGLLIGQLAGRFGPAHLFGIGAIVTGVLLLFMFQAASVPLTFLLHFILGVPAVASRVGLQSLFQQNVAESHRGRVGGIMTTVGSALELLSVGCAGVMGQMVGIVPLLSVASGITILAGIVGLWFLPQGLRRGELTGD